MGLKRQPCAVLAVLAVLTILAVGTSIALATPLLATAEPASTTSAAATPATSAIVAPTGNFDVRFNGHAQLAHEIARAAAAQGHAAFGKREAAAQARSMGAALAHLRQTAPGATAQLSAGTAAPEVVARRGGALSGPASGRLGIDIVRDFLRANADLYGLDAEQIAGLRLLGESISPHSGMRMVRVEQRLGGLLVFQSETRFILDRDGRVWRSLGAIAPRSAAPAALQSAALLSAPAALAKALGTAGIAVDAGHMTSTAGGTVAQARAALLNAAETVSLAASGTFVEVRTHDPQVSGAVRSDLVYFPLAPGILVPAWRQVAFTRSGADWYTVVDAADGTLLWRKNIRASASTQEARFSVYTQSDGVTPATSPAPHDPTDVTPGSGTQFPAINRTIVDMSAAQNLTASPNGWIPDGGSTTTGNNVDAYLDTEGDNAPDAGLLDDNGRPVGNLDTSSNNRDFLGASPRDYGYTPAPQAGNPDAGDDPGTDPSRRGAVTELFYLTNWFHDQLYSYGFDEAAGNFQSDNLGRGGTGGDPILAEAQYPGASTDSSIFSTPPDGMSGRMQILLFDSPAPARDGALDASLVLHELTHGLSNRLIGDANGLVWDVGGGMGEGWSDFYALSLLHGTNAYPPGAEYVVGAYATYQAGGMTDNYLYGLRRFPYSTDHSVNPLTLADIDDVTYDNSGGITPSPLTADLDANGALEVHNIGEIWANTLWGVRSRIIADPAGANGDVPTGNATTLQLITDALKATPINPSLTDGRDAILTADCADNACANEESIWAGFADRGLGYGAVAPLGQVGVLGSSAYMGVSESFQLPFLDVGFVAVQDGFPGDDNSGTIEPGETADLTVDLMNPWLSAAKGVTGATATLTSSTPGVTIIQGSASWGAIAPQNKATSTPFQVSLAASAACAIRMHFTLTVTSSLGTHAVDFFLRVGHRTGAAPTVTYSRTVPGGGLAIPDDVPHGVNDSLTITDDLEISLLQLRVDSLTHPATGDLAIGIKAPNGYGTDLIYYRGFFINDIGGANFVNTVIDESTANDLNLSQSTDAPYTGHWQDAFGSGIWADFGIPNLGPDPINQLDRVTGLSTQGTWTLHVDDAVAGDSGTLNSWSLIVFPILYTCPNSAAPGANVSGSKTVSGSFVPLGAVAYTVTLTNGGTGAQADNPGHELTDVLPAQLLLVSAGASSGTAAANVATNTVTWDGGIAAGGSVTITIQATVKPGAGGAISNQGTISYDSDGDGFNDTTALTGDPAAKTPNAPTVFTVPNAPFLVATKTAGGSLVEGGTVTYTIALSNIGTAAQADNPGNELTDVLPPSLTLTAATATSGAAVANTGTNTVTWNGSLPPSSTVTITITATIKSGTAGTTIANQATFNYDSNNDGTNDATGLSDDPNTVAANDPTAFTVGQAIAAVPTLSGLGLLVLIVALAAIALAMSKRRRGAAGLT